MKKVLTSVLVAAVTFSMCACGGNAASAPSETTAAEASEEAVKEETSAEASSEETEESSEEYDPMVESIDLALEKGAIKYVGFEKANDKLTDADNALVFKFEFTNFQTKPAQTQSVFAIKFYQNGAELSENASYSSGGGDQYTLVKDFFSEALKDGTVTFGQIVLPKDDSPITVMVRRNGGTGSDDDYQMMEVDISDQAAAGENGGDAAAADVSAEEIQEALQGTWAISNGSFSFDNGNVTCLTAGQVLSGTYEINTAESLIDAEFNATNGNVTIKLPYTYENGEMTVFNNRGEALEKE